MTAWWKRATIKSKLLATLTTLLAANSAYFYLSFGSIAKMNQLVLTVYDQVVMASTYSQMVKNDVQRFSALVVAELVAADPAEIQKLRAQREETATAFREDLAVVKERRLSEGDIGAIAELQFLFERLQRPVANPKLSPAEAVRAWQANPDRQALLAKVSDLTDMIVGEGYAFRLDSTKRTEQIRRSTQAFAFGVVFINLICLCVMFLAVLPPLKKLTKACVEIAAGDFNRRVDLRNDDEFGRLAQSFNVMLEALRLSEDRVQTQLRTTKAMMDGLGQGFVMFDANEACAPVFSKACLGLLETNPAGRAISEVLRIPPEAITEFKQWVQVLFLDRGTFDDLVSFGPKTFAHSGGRRVELEYKPLWDEAGRLKMVVVVATDKTVETVARQDALREQAFSKMVVKLVRNRQEFSRFLIAIDHLIAAVGTATPEASIRNLHTIKGAAATLGLDGMRDHAHRFETEIMLDPAKSIAQNAREQLRAEYVRTLGLLETECSFSLDATSKVREVARTAVLEFHGRLNGETPVEELRAAFERDFVFDPIGQFFAPLHEAAKDLAFRQGKRIAHLEITGADLRIHADTYADLFSSLVHVFRNAVDHGIELPEERAAAGKPEAAKISVHARLDSAGALGLTIQDDGRGINVQALRAKLGARVATTASDAEIIQHVFDGGISTAESLTDISGRGVGMSAVRVIVERLGGRVWVESVAGQGTTFKLEIPATDVAFIKAA